MRLFKEYPPESLTYADTKIRAVGSEQDTVKVEAIGYDDKHLKLFFQKARIVTILDGGHDRVEIGKIIKLKNGLKRIFLYNDDFDLFLEIEYENGEYG